MRVAITLEKFDLLRGGAEVATLNLVNELAAHGHELHIVTTANAVELPVGTNVHLVRVPFRFVAWRQISFARQVAQRLQTLGCDISIASCGRAYSEDVLWAQGGTQRAAAQGNQRSFYYNALLRAGSRVQPWLNIRTLTYRELERRCFARRPQPFVIAPSRMIAQGFQSDFGLSAERIRVVPYQINLSRFSPEAIGPLRARAHAALQLEPADIAIVCAAQNFRRKGVRPLVEAAAVLQNNGRCFSVLIAGLTPRHAAPYQRLARRLGCERRVRFLGHTERIEELYAAADVFCLPTFFDPCAIASVEAMACGLPSITSRYNGAAELMTPGADGIVVAEPQDARSLAAALEPLFDAALRAKIGSAAVQTARRISQKSGPNQMARVLEELAGLKREETSSKQTKSSPQRIEQVFCSKE